MDYRGVFFIFFCSLSISIMAQEQLGLRTENYSGINSITLNPANNLTSPFQWDINLVAAGQFVDNNFGGFRSASVGDLFNSNNDFYLATDYRSDQVFPDNSIVFDFSEPGKNKFASIFTEVTGPSFMLNFERHSFGLFTKFRAALSGQNIPAILGYYDYRAVNPLSDYSVAPTQGAGMAWTEIGLNYLFKKELTNGELGFGLNLKYLQGYESFFVKNNQNLQITKLEQDSLSFNNGANIDFGFTTSSIDEEDVSLQKSGSGMGLDIGLTYASTEYLDGYGLKFGFSIIDIGKIKFNQNTEAHKIDINDAFFFNPRNLEDVEDFRDGLAQLNEELYTDSTNTLTGNEYDVWLPTAISLQADFAIKERFFVNAALVHRLAVGEINVKRGNLLAVTPRYESRWISAFLPVSLYNYQHFKVGAAVRLAFLTIGTEDLFSFTRQNSLQSSDFYIALKINPFKLGWKEKGSKDVKCYQF